MSIYPPTTKDHTLRDCAVILLITAAIYLPLLGLDGWDGNEPLRVIVAKGMLQSGNWMIPMLHGKPYFTKPPLMNWLIAASGSLFGTLNEWSTRLPSVFMVFLTGMSVYLLTSKWLSREGRLFAAMATLSMVGLIEKGRTAEIDSLFVFCVTLTLLVWINGYVRQWKPVVLWGVSLLLVGISFLTKGPQAPAYFYMTVAAYLLFRKRVSLLFSKAHLLGILLFLSILLGYLSFVLQWVSLDHYLTMWVGQITDRAESKHSLSFLQHILTYPLEAVLSFMPWTLFLLPIILYKDIRRESHEVSKNEILVFSVAMIVINFPLYWFLPNARFRYFLPAGPFVAIALGVLFEFYLGKARSIPAIGMFFKKMLKILSWIILSAAFILPILVIVMKFSFSLSLILLTASLVCLAVLILRRAESMHLKHIPVLIALLSGFLFLIYTDIHVQDMMKRENYPKKIAGEINSLLPQDAGPVYVIGYRRFLGVTCYLEKEAIQLDGFAGLKALRDKGDGTYFLFDTTLLNKAESAGERSMQDIQWQRVYSKYFSGSKGKIVLGYLQKRSPS
jgi:4-amino-4-deoxy-L-arabinose transferase-like glycosyltransferase